MEEQVTTGAVEETTATEKTYTQEEMNDFLQRETDRRVSDALKKAEKKSEMKVKEAEKLAKMNADEQFQYQLEQREKAIFEKEKMLAMAENKNAASKILAEKGISLDLVDFVTAEDAETMSANIELLDRAFKLSVKMEVEKRLGSNVPKKNLPLSEEVTKEGFRKMPLHQQAAIAKSNPDLYKKLTN